MLQSYLKDLRKITYKNLKKSITKHFEDIGEKSKRKLEKINRNFIKIWRNT